MSLSIRRIIFSIVIFCSLFFSFTLAAEDTDSENTAVLIETSAFMIMNLLPNPGDFYQLGLGYSADEKNIFYITGITWKYSAPLGIPYGSSLGSPDEEYPGYVRAFGLGIGYQRFLWKGVFASVSATPFLQNFYTNDTVLINSGFQLYLTGKLGYQINFFEGRFYIKPAVSFNYWPINTGFPEAFQKLEKEWPEYFLFEPSFNIGFRF